MDDMQSTACFVPFCDTVIERYQTVAALPRHDVLDPALCHGEIHLTVQAKSPLIVGGGRSAASNCIQFDKDPQGRCRIPGSTLRGLIRQNMQILGLGIVQVGRSDDIADSYLYGSRRPADGLPERYLAAIEREILDYPRSIMGFVSIRRGRGKGISQCYRSRVSFGDLTAVGSPRELPPVQISQKQPHQSDKKFVTLGPGGKFRLAGTRQYPLRDEVTSQTHGANQRFTPLDAGTRFTGIIRYRNLHEDELGLLLWCLRLKEGCRQTIGLAKSYGYGQVEVTVDRILEYDPARLYSSLTAGSSTRGSTAERMEHLIRAYQSYACSQPGVKAPGGCLEQMPHIRRFLELKTAVRAETAAPSNKELRMQAKKAAPQATAEQRADWASMLSKRFSQN